MLMTIRIIEVMKSLRTHEIPKTTTINRLIYPLNIQKSDCYFTQATSISHVSVHFCHWYWSRPKSSLSSRKPICRRCCRDKDVTICALLSIHEGTDTQARTHEQTQGMRYMHRVCVFAFRVACTANLFLHLCSLCDYLIIMKWFSSYINWIINIFFVVFIIHFMVKIVCIRSDYITIIRLL